MATVIQMKLVFELAGLEFIWQAILLFY